MTLRRPQSTAVAPVAAVAAVAAGVGVLRGAVTVRPAGDCRARAGSGPRVTAAGQSRLNGIRLRSLTACGVRRNGKDAVRADGLEAGDATAGHNGRQGVGVRHAVRTPAVVGNRGTAGCGGVLVVEDAKVPHAGGLTVCGNLAAANDTYCPSHARLPFVQGAGIVMTGAERTLMVRNRVVDDHRTSPLSGATAPLRSVVGAPDTGNTVRGDTPPGDSPADPADRDQGTADVLRDNTCRVSEPKGLCEE